jgi:uroporphyrinogen III methyltransferase/synthase
MTKAPAPLAGRRIVVTRARAQASDLADRLSALGAEVIHAPVIRIEPLPDLTPLRGALARLASYDWVVFTSQNAVDIACDDAAAFARTSVAAIGPATASALNRRGVRVALMPERHVAEALVDALATVGMRGKRVLIPAAEQARPVLENGLRALGALVEAIPVYRTVASGEDGSALARELQAGTIDAVTFTSSSTVEHFLELVGRPAATRDTFVAAVIGPITAGSARDAGVAGGRLIEASPSTGEGLVTALVRHFQPA